jgi:hypothetical protein
MTERKTKAKPELKAFAVGLGFTAECCQDPHVWIKRVMATSEHDAIDKMAKLAERKGLFFNEETSIVACPMDSFAHMKPKVDPKRKG